MLPSPVRLEDPPCVLSTKRGGGEVVCLSPRNESWVLGELRYQRDTVGAKTARPYPSCHHKNMRGTGKPSVSPVALDKTVPAITARVRSHGISGQIVPSQCSTFRSNKGDRIHSSMSSHKNLIKSRSKHIKHNFKIFIRLIEYFE